MRGRRSSGWLSAVAGDSDLIDIPVALGAILAVLAVFAAFFFVGRSSESSC